MNLVSAQNIPQSFTIVRSLTPTALNLKRRSPLSKEGSTQERMVEKCKNFFSKEGTNILASIAIISADFLKPDAHRALGEKILETTGVCPSALLPKWVTPFFKKYVNYPMWVSGMTGMTDKSKITRHNWHHVVINGPLFEELVDRVILQDCFLKKLPKKLLQRYAPKYAHLTDHLAARVSRVFISSLYFALHHSWSHTGTYGDMYPYMIKGAIFGALQEVTGHPICNSIVHIAGNAFLGKPWNYYIQEPSFFEKLQEFMQL